MNVDEFKKLNDYVQSLDLQKLAKDMNWPLGCAGQIQYAIDKHRDMKKNFLSFFMNLDTVTQAVFLGKALDLKGRGALGDIVFDVVHEFEGHKLEINVGFDHEYDSSYGADADGNRGRPAHFIGVNSMIVTCDNVRIDTILSKEDYSQLQKEIENGFSDKALEQLS
ncbi:hypothetical protein MASR1M48_16460 [Lactococcus petauri]